MPAHPRPTSNKPVAFAPPQRLPYFIAALICLLLALALGYGGWRLFTSRSGAAPGVTSNSGPGAPVSPSPLSTPTREATPSPPQQQPADSAQSFEGEVPVTGGEVVLGGEGTGSPVQRIFVEPFSIAETEVTNEQYALFVKETGHRPATGWKNNTFPPGTATLPVTGVTWQDAVDYCRWLGRKLGVKVRLPTEAEWTRAARGDQNYKYPWGNDWNEQAAVSKEVSSEKHPRAVKSYPAGKSPCGAYDMAGNVWEWVSDDDAAVIYDPETKQSTLVKGKVVKGGAANEERIYISAVSRKVMPALESYEWTGFRYVVLRRGEAK